MLRITAVLVFLISLSTVSLAEGPYEAIGTVNQYDSLRGVIVLDGAEYKLVGEANANLLMGIRRAKLESLIGTEISYRVNPKGDGRTLIDVHVPYESE